MFCAAAVVIAELRKRRLVIERRRNAILRRRVRTLRSVIAAQKEAAEEADPREYLRAAAWN
jgi:hypothetical protein